MEGIFNSEEQDLFKTLVRDFSPHVAFGKMLERAPELDMDREVFRKAFWREVESWKNPDLTQVKRAQDKACQDERKATNTREGPCSRFCNQDWTPDEDDVLLALVKEHRDKGAPFTQQGLSNKQWLTLVPVFNDKFKDSSDKERTACGMRNRYVKLRKQDQQTKRKESAQRAKNQKLARVQRVPLLLSWQQDDDQDDDLLEDLGDVDALPESRVFEVDPYIEQNDDDAGFVPTTTVVNLSAADEEWLVNEDHDTVEDACVQALHAQLGLPKLDSYASKMLVFSCLTQPLPAEWTDLL